MIRKKFTPSLVTAPRSNSLINTYYMFSYTLINLFIVFPHNLIKHTHSMK